MHKHRTKTKSVFSIDLKISGQVLSVPVLQNDTHETLVARFCENHLIKNQHRQIVREKIIQSLEFIIKSGKVQSHLKEKVNRFLSTKGKQNKTIQKSIVEQNQTPFKTIEIPLRKSPENRHVGSQCLKMHSPQKKPAEKPKAKRNPVSKPKQRKSVLDSDLIKAYETIYKRSREANMKNMAKKYLEECGYFKKDSPPQYSEIEIAPDTSINPLELPTEFSPTKIHESFENKRHQRSNQKRNYLQSSENESLIYQNRYNTEVGDFSRYDRPSKSFERMNPPPTIMNKLYEDSRYGYYDEISRREQSLRKTRKYKYLVD